MRQAPLIALTVALAGCSDPVTEIVLEVDSDLTVPAELDRLGIAVWAPGEPSSAEPRLAEADLTEDGLPRTLTLVHGGGPLGPFAVRITGYDGTDDVVERELALTFEQDESLRLRVMLSEACADAACGVGSTCADGSCRPVEVRPCEYEGRSCQDGGVVDAGGVDACFPTEEACNGDDDDCDGDVDEDFDLDTDPLHCGRCERTCPSEGTNVRGGRCESGSCALDCDVGWGDCNRDASDGCETDTDTSMDHCGECGGFCPAAGTFHATDAVCSAGRCLLSCDANWGDCDEDRSTGCETHLVVNDSDCGACDNACLDGERCRDGMCGPS